MIERWRNFLIGTVVFVLMFVGIPIHINNDDGAHNTTETGLEGQFQSFMVQFNKNYDNHTEYKHRFKAFQKSVKEIKKMNGHRKHELDARYGLTKFSDMTSEEFMRLHLQPDLYKRISTVSDSAEDKRDKRSVQNLTTKVDWRQKGVITEINNQKNCGACWAFNTIETIEAMYAIKYGKLVPLSVQQMIDCADYGNQGCSGGDSCSLLDWLVDLDVQLCTAANYPLHLKDEDCKFCNQSLTVQVAEYSCQELIGRENYILSTIEKVGPVGVAVNAMSWQNYLEGIIQYHCGSAPELMNHAVQIVGYDISAEIPHYIVRNSWGPDFGDDGYLYIAIGSNLCGLANEVFALVVA